MPSGTWLRYASALTLQLLALSLALSVVYAALRGALEVRQSWHEQHEAERDQTREAAEVISSDCGIALLPGASVVECLAERIERYVQEEHSDQDLQAQKDMAYWAQALFWLSGLGSVVSLVGLWLLFLSLRQTRTAIADTREIGEAQVRAYVDVVLATDGLMLPTIAVGKKPLATFKIENTGNSPALKKTYAAGLVIREPGFPATEADLVQPVADGPIPSSALGAGAATFGAATLSEPLTSEQVQNIVHADGQQRLYLIGVIGYLDVFQKAHRTRFCAQLEVGILQAGPNQGKPGMNWKVTRRHNDAD